LAEVALVDVVLLVAVEAPAADVPVLARAVTLLARHRHMLADERKAGEVVVEADARPPPLRRVALVALLAEAPEMRILRAMTVVAVVRQLLGRRTRRVTGVAADLLMLADERPFGVMRVIEGWRLPLLIAVAAAALLAQSARVRILSLVTTGAVAR